MQENVGGLEVTMDELADFGHSLGDLQQHGDHFCVRQFPADMDLLLEAALSSRHHNEIRF
jgi:hypothetical protein